MNELIQKRLFLKIKNILIDHICYFVRSHLYDRCNQVRSKRPSKVAYLLELAKKKQLLFRKPPTQTLQEILLIFRY